MPSCGTYLKRIKELSRSGTNREQGNSSRFTRRQDLSLSLSGDWLPDIPSCRAIKTSIIHDGMALYMASLWRAISWAKYLIYMYYYYCYITRKAKVMLWRIVMQGRCYVFDPAAITQGRSFSHWSNLFQLLSSQSRHEISSFCCCWFSVFCFVWSFPTSNVSSPGIFENDIRVCAIP